MYLTFGLILCYAVVFDNTLGRVTATNIRTPRALIEILATDPRDGVDDDETSASREQQEVSLRRKVTLRDPCAFCVVCKHPYAV